MCIGYKESATKYHGQWHLVTKEAGKNKVVVKAKIILCCRPAVIQSKGKLTLVISADIRSLRMNTKIPIDINSLQLLGRHDIAFKGWLIVQWQCHILWQKIWPHRQRFHPISYLTDDSCLYYHYCWELCKFGNLTSQLTQRLVRILSRWMWIWNMHRIITNDEIGHNHIPLSDAYLKKTLTFVEKPILIKCTSNTAFRSDPLEAW